MNRDAKIGIFVLIVICSGVGFVLLAAPTIKRDVYHESRSSLLDFSGESNKKPSRAIIEDDVSLELEVPTGYAEVKSNKTSPITPKQPKEIASSEKKPENIEKQEKPAEQAVSQPIAKAPVSDRKSALKELEESMRNPSIKPDIKLDNTSKNADITKVDENKINPNKSTDKPLDSMVLEDVYYTVKEGDTLSTIARLHYQDSSKHKLISDANKGLSSKDLKIGMKVFIPGTESQKKYATISTPLEKTTMAEVGKTVVYKVKSGDTISSIARKFFGESYSMTEIKKANPGKDLTRLKIGESINIPALSKKN